MPVVYSQYQACRDRGHELNDMNLYEYTCLVDIRENPESQAKRAKAAASTTADSTAADAAASSDHIDKSHRMEEDDDKAMDEGDVENPDHDPRPDTDASSPSKSTRAKAGCKSSLRCAFTNNSPLTADYFQVLRKKYPIAIWANGSPPCAPPFLEEGQEATDTWLLQADRFALKILTVFSPLVSRLDIDQHGYDESHLGVPRALALYADDMRTDWECLIDFMTDNERTFKPHPAYELYRNSLTDGRFNLAQCLQTAAGQGITDQPAPKPTKSKFVPGSVPPAPGNGTRTRVRRPKSTATTTNTTGPPAKPTTRAPVATALARRARQADEQRANALRAAKHIGQYASICVNMRQYAPICANTHVTCVNMRQYAACRNLSICVNMRQYASICVNMRQYASIWVVNMEGCVNVYVIFAVLPY